MVCEVHTGIKKNNTPDENLEAVRDAAAQYGHSLVIERLRFMIDNFSWVKNDEDQRDRITDLISQLEYDRTFSSGAFEPLIIPSGLEEIRARW